MKTTVRSLRLALPILITLVLTLALVVGLTTAFSGEGPKATAPSQKQNALSSHTLPKKASEFSGAPSNVPVVGYALCLPRFHACLY